MIYRKYRTKLPKIDEESQKIIMKAELARVDNGTTTANDHVRAAERLMIRGVFWFLFFFSVFSPVVVTLATEWGAWVSRGALRKAFQTIALKQPCGTRKQWLKDKSKSEESFSSLLSIQSSSRGAVPDG